MTKVRRRDAELDRLNRWKREGSTLVASMDKSRKLINDLENEINELVKQREDRRKAF